MMPPEAGLGSTLYRTTDGFYLLPDDVAPSPGPVALRTLTGEELHVDAQSVARFRVTEAVARIHAKHALTTVAARLESTVSAATKALAGLDPVGSTSPGASAIEDLSAQLEAMVQTFRQADLTTAAGRATVEAELASLARTKDKAQLEALVANTHRGLGDILTAIDAEALSDGTGTDPEGA